MQTGEPHRPDVTGAQLRTSASCDGGGSLVDDLGPGNDWRCVVTWQTPSATATGSAVYQLDVTPDGRYVADGDGPQEVDGFFQVRTATCDAPIPCGSSTAPSICRRPLRRTREGESHEPGLCVALAFFSGCVDVGVLSWSRQRSRVVITEAKGRI